MKKIYFGNIKKTLKFETAFHKNSLVNQDFNENITRQIFGFDFFCWQIISFTYDLREKSYRFSSFWGLRRSILYQIRRSQMKNSRSIWQQRKTAILIVDFSNCRRDVNLIIFQLFWFLQVKKFTQGDNQRIFYKQKKICFILSWIFHKFLREKLFLLFS